MQDILMLYTMPQMMMRPDRTGQQLQARMRIAPMHPSEWHEPFLYRFLL